MPISKSIILLFFTTFALIACEKEKPIAKKPEEVYDWHNEKYQDFYSQYMRKVENMEQMKSYIPLTFDNKDIEKYLSVKNIPQNAAGNIMPRRYPLSLNLTFPRNENYFKDRIDVKNYYSQKMTTDKSYHYELCEQSDEEIGLFCIHNTFFNRLIYFYLPNESPKIPFINQSINFYCEKIDTKKMCRISTITIYPYNIWLVVDFTSPKNFFYVMPYTENYFYQTTGVHLWQTLPKRN